MCGHRNSDYGPLLALLPPAFPVAMARLVPTGRPCRGGPCVWGGSNGRVSIRQEDRMMGAIDAWE